MKSCKREHIHDLKRPVRLLLDERRTMLGARIRQLESYWNAKALNGETIVSSMHVLQTAQTSASCLMFYRRRVPAVEKLFHEFCQRSSSLNAGRLARRVAVAFNVAPSSRLVITRVEVFSKCERR